MPGTMIANVVEFVDGFYSLDVETDDPKFHRMYLLPRQMNGTRVGDRVSIVYRSSMSSGGWVVDRKVTEGDQS